MRYSHIVEYMTILKQIKMGILLQYYGRNWCFVG